MDSENLKSFHLGFYSLNILFKKIKKKTIKITFYRIKSSYNIFNFTKLY